MELVFINKTNRFVHASSSIEAKQLNSRYVRLVIVKNEYKKTEFKFKILDVINSTMAKFCYYKSMNSRYSVVSAISFVPLAKATATCCNENKLLIINNLSNLL